MVEEMKALREEQHWSWTKIGDLFRIDAHSVRYWVDQTYKQNCINRAKRRQRKELTPEQREKRREYMRNYIHSRYTEDPEFKSRMLKHMKKWQKKKKGDKNDRTLGTSG